MRVILRHAVFAVVQVAQTHAADLKVGTTYDSPDLLNALHARFMLRTPTLW